MFSLKRKRDKGEGESYHGHHLYCLTRSVPRPVVVEAIVDAVNQLILLTVIELHEAVHINNNKIITNYYCYRIIYYYFTLLNIQIIIVYFEKIV